jgi:hypothetical protein
MARFPSVEWLDEVRGVFNTHPEYHGAGGGRCNAAVGLKVGDDNFLVQFKGLECVEAREVTDDDLVEADFYLDMEPDEWQAMLASIKDNGHAGLDYTLNTIDLNKAPRGLAISKTNDQYRTDLFYRFNQTLQFFFDASSKVDTQF